MTPTVSVIISTYNRRHLLPVALQSVLRQRFDDFEVIVVDNGSTDGTSAVLDDFDDPRLVRVRNEVSLGPTGGRNCGIDRARGRWVSVLDDDDMWSPDKLAAQVDALQRSGRTWAFSGVVFIGRAGNVLAGAPPPDADRVMRTLPHLYSVPGGASSVIWERGALDQGGRLDPGLFYTIDWDLCLRLARTGPPAVVSAPHVAYRLHGANMSRFAASFEHEFDIIEEKFGDLRNGRPVWRAAHHRYLGGVLLRGGERRAAAACYVRAVAAGDWSSLLRLVSVVLPNSVSERAVRWFRSEQRYLREARTWVPSRAHRRPSVNQIQPSETARLRS